MLSRLATCLLLCSAAGAVWSQEPLETTPQENASSSERRESRRLRERRPDRRWSSWSDRRGRDERRSWERERRGPRYHRESEHFSIDSGEIVRGYVFLNGQYLPPPYRLRVDRSGLRLNDNKLTLTAGGEPVDDSRREREWHYRLQSELYNDAVVTIESRRAGAPSDGVKADNAMHFISIYPRSKTGTAILREIADRGSSTADKKLLPKFLASYSPPADLVARATQDIESFESLGSDSATDALSTVNWAYPLTVIGMFLAAVAVGQLFVSRSLLSRPKVDDSPEITRAAVGCILVVAGLSVLDLIWTILSVRAGIMYELNPLATQFLSSSLALTSFKIGITLCGATILYLCRYHRPAQLASWWLCMVCTLVTVRWVAFTSLFVT